MFKMNLQNLADTLFIVSNKIHVMFHTLGIAVIRAVQSPPCSPPCLFT